MSPAAIALVVCIAALAQRPPQASSTDVNQIKHPGRAVAAGPPPMIYGVADAATMTPTLGSPDGIVFVYGTNLALTAAAAPSVPLPRQLGGTTVTWNGIAAPLFYVSPTQITLQVPVLGPLTNGRAISVVVSTADGSSAAYNPAISTPSAWNTAGIFALDGSGCGRGAIENVGSDGNVTINSPANSASPGDWITAYGTGASGSGSSYYNNTGYLSLPPDGDYPTSGFNGSGYNFGLDSEKQFDLSGDILYVGGWSGFAPTYVGLNQYNIRIPSSTREGCSVPLQLLYLSPSRAKSPPVTLAIRKGGGACVDPPSAGFGQITFEKHASTSASNTVTAWDTLTVSLQAAPGQQAPPVPTYPRETVGFGYAWSWTGTSCPVPGYRSLGAGSVTVQGPGVASAQVPSVLLDQNQVSGLQSYQSTFPAGAIQPGKYTVTAGGGPDVGGFQAPAQIGADIQIQTQLAGTDMRAACFGAFPIKWTGGDPNSWVTVSFLPPPGSNAPGPAQQLMFLSQGHVSNGGLNVFLGGDIVGCRSFLQQRPYQGVLSIEVTPDPSEITPFTAPGLSLGGQVTWKYTHTYPITLYLWK